MREPKPRGKRRLPASTLPVAPEEQAFAEVVAMIQAARGQAVAAVNTALIDLYWRIGEHISRKLESAAWGEGVVEALASYIQRHHPNLKGFTRRNLFRMRQFFEAYKGDEKVSALLAQLPWSHHLIILGQSKRSEEREFYLRLAIRERWSSRELERQLRTAAFERAVLSPAKVSPLVAQMHPRGVGRLQRLLRGRIPGAAGRPLRERPASRARSQAEGLPDRAGPRLLLRGLRVSGAGGES
jgi:predicted nuclease of restriction endonuclease-like (RecB) superfamily